MGILPYRMKIMQKRKKIGIWMDHSSAELMEFTTDLLETRTVSAESMDHDNEDSHNKSEHTTHNKEQHLLSAYYQRLAEILINYEDIFLFGPTDAKKELFNILKENQHFSRMNIQLEQTDKMTDNQKRALVRTHFTKH